ASRPTAERQLSSLATTCEVPDTRPRGWTHGSGAPGPAVHDHATPSPLRNVAELEAFNHTIAHTLRAPLRAAQGYADAVREEQADRLDPAAREHLARMFRAVHHMDDLVTDLLE